MIKRLYGSGSSIYLAVVGVGATIGHSQPVGLAERVLMVQVLIIEVLAINRPPTVAVSSREIACIATET